jgi:hypothetical protein
MAWVRFPQDAFFFWLSFQTGVDVPSGWMGLGWEGWSQKEKKQKKQKKKKVGQYENRTRDLSHPKRESYH